MAVANYHEQHGHFPPPYIADANGRPMHSWRVLILPFLEQGELYAQYDMSEPWDGPNNRKLAARMPQIYAFHGDYQPGLTTTNYLAVVGPETVWSTRERRSFKNIIDRPGATILIAENRGLEVHWMEPRDLSFADMSFEVNSPAGVSSKYTDPAVAMLDGSLHRLRKELPPATLKAMLTANGGEKIRGEDVGEWSLLPDGRDREPARP